MIKEVLMYTIICDNCGTNSCDGTEYSAWTDGYSAEEMASYDDWFKDGDKHYCPKCYYHDDNDELTINLAGEKVEL